MHKIAQNLSICAMQKYKKLFIPRTRTPIYLKRREINRDFSSDLRRFVVTSRKNIQ